MMYNIDLNIGPSILLFITNYLYILILWNYIHFNTYLFYIIYKLRYIYKPMVMYIAIFLMNFVFNVNFKIPKY
jgi:hypothetical protein